MYFLFLRILFSHSNSFFVRRRNLYSREIIFDVIREMELAVSFVSLWGFGFFIFSAFANNPNPFKAMFIRFWFSTFLYRNYTSFSIRSLVLFFSLASVALYCRFLCQACRTSSGRDNSTKDKIWQCTWLLLRRACQELECMPRACHWRLRVMLFDFLS